MFSNQRFHPLVISNAELQHLSSSFQKVSFCKIRNISRCRTSRNFPEECFCWDRVCGHPSLPIHKLFMKLKTHGEEFKQIYPGEKRTKRSFFDSIYLILGMFSWKVDQRDMKINATFKMIMNRQGNSEDQAPSNYQRLTKF